MKKLIEALHVIQDECKKHIKCKEEPACPFYINGSCGVKDEYPEYWEINDMEVQKALLRKEQT